MEESEKTVPEPRDPALTTTAKTLWIYTVLSRFSPNGVYLHELAEACGMPRRSVERHLQFLRHFGFVRQTGTRRYCVNPAVRLPLGTADHEGIDKVLTDFVGRTERDVALATLNGGKLVITHLHKNPKGQSLLENIHPKAAHATGSGKCLLAQLSSAEERRRLMILTGMPRFTDRTITNFETLEANLQKQEGELWSAQGEYCETGACLAVLVHPGSIHGDNIALTTSVEASEFAHAKEHLAANLHRTVARLQPVIGPLLPPSFGPIST